MTPMVAEAKDSYIAGKFQRGVLVVDAWCALKDLHNSFGAINLQDLTSANASIA